MASKGENSKGCFLFRVSLAAPLLVALVMGMSVEVCSIYGCLIGVVSRCFVLPHVVGIDEEEGRKR